ncbi:MAG: zinc ribbon domain-containing protein [Phycisphaeraceae bacterium JB051]
MKTRRMIVRCIIGLVMMHLVLMYIFLYSPYPWVSSLLFLNVLIMTGVVVLIYPASWLAHLRGGQHASWCAMAWVMIIGFACYSLPWLGSIHRYLWLSPAWSSLRVEKMILPILLTLLSAGLIQSLALYLKQFSVVKNAAKLLAILMLIYPIFVCAGFLYLPVNRRADMLLAYGWMGTLFGLLGVFVCVGSWRWHKVVVLICLFMLAAASSLHHSLGLIPSQYFQVVPWMMVLVLYYAHGNILYLLSVGQNRWPMMFLVNWSLILTSLILGVIGVGFSFAGFDGRSATVELAMGLSVMLEMIGVVFTGILLFCFAIQRIRINRQPADNQINYSSMQVTCPHCQTALLLSESGQTCVTCGLQFNFHLIEPHCPECHYLLIGMSHSNCPECGASIQSNTAQIVGPLAT